MDYEKAYKEALERAREFQKSKDGLCVLTAELIFPELKESEDERIRKELYDFVYITTFRPKELKKKERFLAWLEKQKSVGETVERCKNSWYNEGKIAGMTEGLTNDEKYQQGWHDALEKQGEQKPVIIEIKSLEESLWVSSKEYNEIIIECLYGESKPADKVEPKFENGQWIVWKDKFYKVNYNGCGYELIDQNGLKTSLEYSTVDENAHIFTTQDAKDGDVLYSLDSKQPFIFKHRKTNEQAAVYCGINTYGKFFIWNTKDCVITTDKYIPADKSQRDILFKEMQEAGYQWDAEKKELKLLISNGGDFESNNSKQKPTWSEEDEEMIDKIIDYMKPMPIFFESTKGKSGKEYTKEFIKNAIKWLKSIKGRIQPQQKWTEEDENGFGETLWAINKARTIAENENDMGNLWYAENWLKSFKERLS